MFCAIVANGFSDLPETYEIDFCIVCHSTEISMDPHHNRAGLIGAHVQKSAQVRAAISMTSALRLLDISIHCSRASRRYAAAGSCELNDRGDRHCHTAWCH